MVHEAGKQLTTARVCPGPGVSAVLRSGAQRPGLGPGHSHHHDRSRDNQGVHMEQTWTIISRPSVPDDTPHADTDQTVQWHYS